jgi:hypothetical protein
VFHKVILVVAQGLLDQREQFAPVQKTPQPFHVPHGSDFPDGTSRADESVGLREVEIFEARREN